MKAYRRSIGVLAVSVSLVSATVLAQTEPKDLTMEVLSITRSTQWPLPPAEAILKPTPGSDVEIVIVSIKTVTKKINDIYGDAVLIDADGEEHRAAADSLTNIDNQPKVYKQTWVFSLKKTMKLRAIRIGPVTLEIVKEVSIEPKAK